MKRARIGFLVVATAVGLIGLACGKKSPTAPPVTAADVVIQITGINGSSSFSPNPASVKMGQTVSWRNQDALTHSATPDGIGFTSVDVGPGSTSAPQTITVSVADYGYHCRFHGGMVGTLRVIP